MSVDFALFEAQRIRLRLLQALAEQAVRPASLTASMLVRHLSTKGYRKSEDYVLIQLNWLASQALAVRLVPAGEETVAVLLKAGRDHVDGVSLIPGVDAPEDEV